MKLIYRIVSVLLIIPILLGVAGCSRSVSCRDLAKDYVTESSEVDPKELSKSRSEAYLDFSAELFERSHKKGENLLISPLSVFTALAMSSKGANGETLKEFEKLFGMEETSAGLFLSAYLSNLPQGEKYKLYPANSIWWTDDERFTINEAFVKKNAELFKAEIYKAPFDNTTLRDINNWVDLRTDGMIKKILETIGKDDIMCLINALSFEAEWDETYSKHSGKTETFISEKGEKQKCRLMHSEESVYIEDDNTKGFVKYYKDKKYAFVALLPDEDVKFSSYVKKLSGEKLENLLSNKEDTTVYAAIPKFSYDYSVKLNEILKEMGMTKAFDPYMADFSGIGRSTKGNIYISEVIHKTTITVDEMGTKAGAATALVYKDSAAPMDPKIVTLNRPFIYLIIDTQNNLPIFIGSVADMENMK